MTRIIAELSFFKGAGGCGQWVIIQIIIHNDIYNYKVIVKVSK